MSKSLAFVGLLIVVNVAICAPSRIAPPKEKVDHVLSDLVTPVIGIESTSEIGNAIYQQSIERATTTYRASTKQSVKVELERGYSLDVAKGGGGPVQIHSFTGATMVCFLARGSGVLGFFGDKNVMGCLIDKQKSGAFDAATFPQYDKYFPLKEPVEYEMTKDKSLSEVSESVSYRLIYQGLSKGEVKIAYRESVNSMARPAFDQDLTYELDKSGKGIIAVKGVRIRVLEATGSNIRYIVDIPGASLLNK